jgi:hypothetical protein
LQYYQLYYAPLDVARREQTTTEQKIIRTKAGLLQLAKQLGNVSQACKMMGYSRDSAVFMPSSASVKDLATEWPGNPVLSCRPTFLGHIGPRRLKARFQLSHLVETRSTRSENLANCSSISRSLPSMPVTILLLSVLFSVTTLIVSSSEESLSVGSNIDFSGGVSIIFQRSLQPLGGRLMVRMQSVACVGAKLHRRDATAQVSQRPLNRLDGRDHGFPDPSGVSSRRFGFGDRAVQLRTNDRQGPRHLGA